MYSTAACGILPAYGRNLLRYVFGMSRPEVIQLVGTLRSAWCRLQNLHEAWTTSPAGIHVFAVLTVSTCELTGYRPGRLWCPTSARLRDPRRSSTEARRSGRSGGTIPCGAPREQRGML